MQCVVAYGAAVPWVLSRRLFETGILGLFGTVGGSGKSRWRWRIAVRREERGASVPPVALGRLGESLLQKMDRDDEVVTLDEHHQVDRIEVGFAAKATA